MFTHTHHTAWRRPMAALLVFMLATTAQAHPGHGTSEEPGFRPDSEHSAEFLASIESASVAVLPVMVRRQERTAFSYAAQAEVMKMLGEAGPGTAVSKGKRLDFGGLRDRAYGSQWEAFEHTMSMVGEFVAGYDAGTDYLLAMEFLAPEEGSLFGVHLYIIRSDGENAFSFLLNSHHAMFSDAHLFADDASEAAHDAMLLDAARLGVTALREQIARAQRPSPVQLN